MPDFHHSTETRSRAAETSAEPSRRPGAKAAHPVDRRPAAAKFNEVVGANRTGLPDTLKAGVESLSGVSLEGVRVHRNSPKPAQLNAHAFAQGTEIHVSPGQEKHLPHETWHLVQQAQGRVAATTKSVTGAPVNKDQRLEQEADAMGLKASQFGVRSGDAPGGAHAADCGCGACHGPASQHAAPVSASPAVQTGGVAQLCEHGHPWHSHLAVCPDPPFSYFSVPLPAPRPAASAAASGGGGSSGAAAAAPVALPPPAMPSVAAAAAASHVASGGSSSGGAMSPAVAHASSPDSGAASPAVAPAPASGSAAAASPAAVSGAGGGGGVPAAPAGVSARAWRRTLDRGVQLGVAHRAASARAGKTVSTAKTEERLTRHMTAHLEGRPSKARPLGAAAGGNDIAWEVDRATAAKQAARGSRQVLQHMGGGDDSDPLDFFEDGSGHMSDTDDSDSEAGSAD